MFSRSVRHSALKHSVAKKPITSWRGMAQTPKKAADQKPLQSSLFGFVVKTGFYGSLLLLGATTVAINSEDFQNIYIDYVPMGETLIDGLDYAWKHKQEALSFNYAGFFNNKKAETIHSLNEVSGKVGLGPLIEEPEIKNSVSSPAIQQSKEEQFIVLNEKPKIVQPVHSKEQDKSVVAEQKKKGEAKLVLPVIVLESSDPEIQKIVKTVNSLITSINNSAVSEKSQKTIDSIKTHLSEMSSKYQKIMSGKASDIKELQDAELKKFQTKLADEKVQLTKDMISQLEDAKKTIETKFQKRLEIETEESQKAFAIEAQNVILKSNIDATEEFIDIVGKAVSAERDSKLKDLDVVASRVAIVEALEIELSKNALSFHQYKKIQKSIASIQKLLLSNESSPSRGKDLVFQLDQLKSLTSGLNDPLINATIDAFPSNKELLTTGGSLTQSQLIERWNILANELRTVSLLPENAGILGYLASHIFSKALFSKSGVSEKSQSAGLMGNDIEAVIARVNNYLQKNQLDNAVEEVALLKGTPRQLSEDWLLESRRKLEMQLLTELLDNEIHVSI